MSVDDRRDSRKSSISRRTFMRRSAVGAVSLALADGILTESATLAQPVPKRAPAASKVVLVRDKAGRQPGYMFLAYGLRRIRQLLAAAAHGTRDYKRRLRRHLVDHDLISSRMRYRGRPRFRLSPVQPQPRRIIDTCYILRSRRYDRQPYIREHRDVLQRLVRIRLGRRCLG